MPPVVCYYTPVVGLFTAYFLSRVFSDFVYLVFMCACFERGKMCGCVLYLVSFLMTVVYGERGLTLLSLPTVRFVCLAFLGCEYGVGGRVARLLGCVPFLFVLYVCFVYVRGIFGVRAVRSGSVRGTAFSAHCVTVLLPTFVGTVFNFRTFALILVVAVT